MAFSASSRPLITVRVSALTRGVSIAYNSLVGLRPTGLDREGM